MFDQFRNKYYWVVNALFFFTCVAAGFNYIIGFAVLGLVFVFLLFAWALETSQTNRAITALSICIFMGVLHEPITHGRAIFFAQEGLLIIVFLAVLLGRYSNPLSVHLAVAIPIFFFATILTPLSLLDYPFLVVMNGLRKWIFPLVMFFIGQLIYQEAMEKTVVKFMLWAVIIQVPAVIFIGAMWTGGSMVVPHPDFLTGTFGIGGTTAIAVLAPTSVVWGMWAAWNGQIPKRLAVLALGAFGILLALCEIKLALIITPLMFGMLMFLNMAAHKKLKKMVLNPLVIVIPAAALGLLLMIGDRLLKYETTETGFIGVNIFELQDMEKYFAYDTGGVRQRYSLTHGEMVSELSRLGMVMESIRHTTQSPARLLFGYGLDSVIDSAMQESLLKSMSGVDAISYQLFSFLLFEGGLLGLFAFFGPILYFFFLSVELFIRPPPGVSNLLVTGVMLFSFVSLVSFIYNDAFRFLPFGGVFWFLCGMLYAQRLDSQRKMLEQA